MNGGDKKREASATCSSLFPSLLVSKSPIIYLSLSLSVCVETYIFIYSLHIKRKSIESPMCGPLSDQLNIEMQSQERRTHTYISIREAPIALCFLCLCGRAGWMNHLRLASRSVLQTRSVSIFPRMGKKKQQKKKTQQTTCNNISIYCPVSNVPHNLPAREGMNN